MLDDAILTVFPLDKNYYLWLTFTNKGDVWYITSDRMRTEYQLWRGKKKTKYTSSNPTSFKKYIEGDIK